jgi:hypothetical protein
MIVKQNSDFLRFQGASQQDTDWNPDRLAAKRKSVCDSIHLEPDYPHSTFDHRRAQTVNGLDSLLSPWQSRGARAVADDRPVWPGCRKIRPVVIHFHTFFTQPSSTFRPSLTESLRKATPFDKNDQWGGG